MGNCHALDNITHMYIIIPTGESPNLLQSVHLTVALQTCCSVLLGWVWAAPSQVVRSLSQTEADPRGGTVADWSGRDGSSRVRWDRDSEQCSAVWEFRCATGRQNYCSGNMQLLLFCLAARISWAAARDQVTLSPTLLLYCILHFLVH